MGRHCRQQWGLTACAQPLQSTARIGHQQRSPDLRSRLTKQAPPLTLDTIRQPARTRAHWACQAAAACRAASCHRARLEGGTAAASAAAAAGTTWADDARAVGGVEGSASPASSTSRCLVSAVVRQGTDQHHAEHAPGGSVRCTGGRAATCLRCTAKRRGHCKQPDSCSLKIRATADGTPPGANASARRTVT